MMSNVCRLFVTLLLSYSGAAVTLASGSEPQDLFAALDANKNGMLETNEIGADHTRLFTRLLRTADADSDGQLALEEFEAGLQPQRQDKPLPEKREGGFPGDDALLLLIVRMDANSDRTILADEVPEELRGFFEQVQAVVGGEQDGRLSQREIIQAAPRLSLLALRYTKVHNFDVEVELALLSDEQFALVERMQGPNRPGEMLADPKSAAEMFANLDADGNGQITADEVPPPLADRFEQLLERADQNRDGQLGKKELLTVSRRLSALNKQRPPQAEIDRRLARFLGQFDKNGDNQLSREEVPQRLRDRFDRVDADGNSSLDRQELSIVVGLLKKIRKPETAPAE